MRGDALSIGGRAAAQKDLRVVLLDGGVNEAVCVSRTLVSASVFHQGLEVVAVRTLASLRARLSWFGVDVVVTEFDLGKGRTSAALVAELIRVGVPVLLFTACPQRAIEAVGLDVPIFAKSPEVIDELLAEIERHRGHPPSEGLARGQKRGST